MPKDLTGLQSAYARVNAQPPKAYDFGGGDYPYDAESRQPSVTVVDIMPESEFRGMKYKNPFIQVDLHKPIRLQPVKKIYTNQMVKYIRMKNLPTLARTIFDALLPGGTIEINENYFNGWAENFVLRDELLKLGMKQISGDNPDTFPPEIVQFLKKHGVSDVRRMSMKQADALDEDGTFAGEMNFVFKK